MVLHYLMQHPQQENCMSALPKNGLPKEFKIISRKPLSRQGPLRQPVMADHAAVNPEDQGDTHQRFKEALHAAFGMWKDRDDIPRDGLEYERWVRGKCP
jgi:hypothetical protein